MDKILCLEDNKGYAEDEIYSKSSIEDLELVNYIYINNDNCYMKVFSKTNRKSYFYDVTSFKEEDIQIDMFNTFGNRDLFFSLNTFRSCKSSTRKNLFCINCIAIDVDYKRVREFKDLEPGQIINLLELDFFDRLVPLPNLVEYGNQVRLIYRLDDSVYIPKNRDNAITLARRISEVFADSLKEYGADKQNIESYFRVPNSINTKNNSIVKIFRYDNSVTYSMKELQELWMDELPNWYKRKVGKRKIPNKVVKLHNVYSLNTNRLLDFEIIQDWLNLNNRSDLRNRLCFLYRNYWLIRAKYQNGSISSKDYEEARSKMLDFNSKFKYPLRANVIESATRCVNHTQYLYKNLTLARFLDFDFDFCSNIGLQSIYKIKGKTDINFDYYNTSNYYNINKKKYKDRYFKKLCVNNNITKKEKVELEVIKIKELIKLGHTKKEIAKELSISVETVKRRIRLMK